MSELAGLLPRQDQVLLEFFSHCASSLSFHEDDFLQWFDPIPPDLLGTRFKESALLSLFSRRTTLHH